MFAHVEWQKLIYSRSRFPVISGFRVSWDSRRPAGQRVLGIWLQKDIPEPRSNSEACIKHADGDEIKREKGGRKYKILTREYLAQGHDGYLALKGNKYLIDEEVGQMPKTLVRKYLLVSTITSR